jgi:DNA-binding NtrC family response regulator
MAIVHKETFQQHDGRKAETMAKKNERILIIDDEEAIRDGCRQVLSRKCYSVETIGNALQGLAMALLDVYDVIVLDIRMSGMDGFEILKRLKGERSISAKVIIITGYGNVPLAVEAMRQGASDFLTKPYSASELLDAVEKALEERETPRPETEIPVLVGSSDYMNELKKSVMRIAPTDSTVLITGESGTGKELVARTFHNLSKRAKRSFVPVDCSSLVETLMESELFGHVKGAFSGATESREGRFQMADEGTLFLDEISNISLNIQAKLLRAIQEQEVPRVGKSTVEKVDTRLIVATNRDLRREIEAGRFREDLFYRISVVPIHIKPLREHTTDILPLARHYFNIYAAKHGSKVRKLSEEAEKSLVAYRWPGNIRELKNTVERLCVLCDREVVNPSDIFYYGQSGGAKAPVLDASSGRMTLIDVEKEHIVKALRHFRFQINTTAQFLGIDRKTLRIKMRNYGIGTETPQ